MMSQRGASIDDLFDAVERRQISPHAHSRTTRRSLRSRAGCETCKRRHVKCDERRPACGHCSRLRLECFYPRTSSVLPRDREDQGLSTATSILPLPRLQPSFHAQSGASENFQVDVPRQTWTTNDWHTSPELTYVQSRRPQQDPWFEADNLDFDGHLLDTYPSWAGYILETPSDFECSPTLITTRTEAPNDNTSSRNLSRNFTTEVPVDQLTTRTNSNNNSSLPNQRDPSFEQLLSSSKIHTDNQDPEAQHLISLFAKIIQPPGAILLSGVRNWRRLQQHLVAMSDRCSVVLNALLCVIELLFIEEISRSPSQNRDGCLKSILERHNLALSEVQAIMAVKTQFDQSSSEQLLAAVLLLAWYEVIRDQDGRPSQFPRDLADTVIINDIDWSQPSRQLLSWLNVLDSKATHLSGEPLLSERALRVVARHPIRVVGSNPEAVDTETEHDSLERVPDVALKQHNLSTSDLSMGRSTRVAPTAGRIKQILLHSIIQPAIEWYISTQSFCRRIGSHDRHNRKRGTPDDEYAVITECKLLEQDLREVWSQRPTIMSLEKEELATSLPLDLAIRLQELFSVYLASYWILFVYLHRVVWWHLDHSPATSAALTNVWQHLQKCYGEIIDGHGKRIVHPVMLWPLFLFGSECPDESRRTWAIEQLEALGESRPILQSHENNDELLPPFRLSPGATKNAKRAALLLKELIKRQDQIKARVDDRDLSMEMFGCYFSIV